MHFNTLLFCMALLAVVHGAAISRVRAPPAAKSRSVAPVPNRSAVQTPPARSIVPSAVSKDTDRAVYGFKSGKFCGKNAILSTDYACIKTRSPGNRLHVSQGRDQRFCEMRCYTLKSTLR